MPGSGWYASTKAQQRQAPAPHDQIRPILPGRRGPAVSAVRILTSMIVIGIVNRAGQEKRERLTLVEPLRELLCFCVDEEEYQIEKCDEMLSEANVALLDTIVDQDA